MISVINCGLIKSCKKYFSKAIPCIRFNKVGTLLAVSANDNRVKVLATPDGLPLMSSYENQALTIPRIAPENVKKVIWLSNLEML